MVVQQLHDLLEITEIIEINCEIIEINREIIEINHEIIGDYLKVWSH